MFHLGTIVYFMIWIPLHIMGHSWIGMLAGVLGCIAWWMGCWWWEFGTVKFWGKI